MKVLRQDPTPNPDALKFVLERQILSTGSRSWRIGDRPDLPLAAQLLAVEGVVSLFFVANVITISKDAYTDWTPIAAQVLQILDHAEEPEFAQLTRPAAAPASPVPDLDDSKYRADPDFFSKPESLRIEYLNDVLDEFVRPGLASDGGGLLLTDLLGRVARIAYQGACGTCPSAASGTLSFIEHILKSRVHPDIVVELV
jgi:Fe-S cluster biogenesis protein NfuA